MTGAVAGEVSKVIMPYSTPAAGEKSAVFRAGYFSGHVVKADCHPDRAEAGEGSINWVAAPVTAWPNVYTFGYRIPFRRHSGIYPCSLVGP
jgi:hypothetical protein